MFKNLKTIVATTSLLVVLGSQVSPVSAASCLQNMTGSGTSSDPCVITNAKQLQSLASNPKLAYVLGNDIDASETKAWNNGLGFAPIANFGGSLDGKNHKIDNLYINRPAVNRVGLFSTTNGAKVKDLSLENAEVHGKDFTGILIGDGSNNELNHVSVSGKVDGYKVIGGLGGMIRSTNISTSSSDADVLAQNTVAGGLVGILINGNKTVSDTSATGDVQAVAFAGGLVGDMSNGSTGKAYLKNSFATGNVSAAGSSEGITNYYAGGLFGIARHVVMTNVYATGEIKAASFAGGLSAFLQDSTVDKAYAKGNVTTAGDLAGGFVGNSAGNNNINDAHAEGTVTATGPNSYWVGGFAGRSITGTVISNSSAIGDVTSSSYDVGGFIGHAFGTKVLQSSAAGNVKSTLAPSAIKNVGKFLGSANGNVYVENSVSEGIADGGNKFVGGMTKTNNVIKNSF